VDFSQHHLPEGYIGDPADDLRLLDESERLLADVAEGRRRAELLEDAQAFRRQAEHWRDHGCSPPGTSPHSLTVYFDKP
jgi:hypothetical protein